MADGAGVDFSWKEDDDERRASELRLQSYSPFAADRRGDSISTPAGRGGGVGATQSALQEQVRRLERELAAVRAAEAAHRRKAAEAEQAALATSTDPETQLVCVVLELLTLAGGSVPDASAVRVAMSAAGITADSATEAQLIAVASGLRGGGGEGREGGV